MLHSRGVNNKVNHLHERSLRIVYKDNIISLEDILKSDKLLTINQRNIQSLAIKLFKIKGNLSNKCTTFFKLEILTTTRGHKVTSPVIV